MKLILAAVMIGLINCVEYQGQAPRVDWLQEESDKVSFMVAMPKSQYPCGTHLTHSLACVYCVNGACHQSELVKDELIHVHYETDPASCVNHLRILTAPSSAMCPSFVNQVMITN